MHKHPLNL